MVKSQAPFPVPPFALSGGDQGGNEDITAQAIAPLLDAACVVAGMDVLDVACGAGHASHSAAERGAAVVGVDLSPAQVARAADRYPTLGFRVADASDLPFGDAAFDRVISNFGTPHFADPARFLREAFRLLRPGGRLAFTQWVDPDAGRQPAPLCFAARADERADERVDAYHAPVPVFFGLGDHRHCRAALGAAGFTAIMIVELRTVSRVASADAMLDAVMEGVARAAGLLGAETPEAIAAIRATLRERIDGCASEDALTLTMPAILVSATRR